MLYTNWLLIEFWSCILNINNDIKLRCVWRSHNPTQIEVLGCGVVPLFLVGTDPWPNQMRTISLAITR